MDENKVLKIANWNLPNCVKDVYKQNGVEYMFPWQAECLTMKGVLQGKNLVFSAPTSAGKTFVAEILMLKRAIETKLKVLFILPFVSVAREKLFYLQKLYSDAGIQVDGYMGGYAPSNGVSGWDIAVCTIEKANGVVNRLIADEKIGCLGMIVVDELHMVGDQGRGYILELLLTKILYISQIRDEVNIQIIGMSATLPNLELVSQWLKAVLYKTTFRPVPLERNLKINGVIFDDRLNEVRKFSPKFPFEKDDEQVISLCYETVCNGHSVLIFCPTKNWCENLAHNIAHQFFNLNEAHNKKKTKENVSLNIIEIKDVMVQLNRSPSLVDPILCRTIPLGVAYHHAGLTIEERDIVERGFRNGGIRVLVATSTLSSGVNLPARRVIIRSPMFNRNLLDVRTYRQMTGRAGRKGVDDKGESILICKTTETAKAKTLLQADELPIKSCLYDDKDLSMCMKRAILEIVVNGVANSYADIMCYVNCTLLAAEAHGTNSQVETVSGDMIDSCMSWLIDHEFMFTKCIDEVKTIFPTQLGRAALLSSLPITDALVVLSDLNSALKGIALNTDLHLAYLVTPIFCFNDWVGLDWHTYLNMFEAFPSPIKNVAKLVGIEEQFLMQMASTHGYIPNFKSNKKGEKFHQLLRIHRRFYAALALHDLILEKPLWKVSQNYSCNKGMLQQLQQSSSSFAGMVTVFCQELGWWNLEVLLKEFQTRLAFGVQRELVDLMRVTLLNGQRARAIYNAGFTTCEKLSEAMQPDIETILKNAIEFQSTKQTFNESEWEVNERKKLRSIHVTGQNGLTEEMAAQLIIKEATKLCKKATCNNSVLSENKIELDKTEDTNTNIFEKDAKVKDEGDQHIEISTKNSEAGNNSSDLNSSSFVFTNSTIDISNTSKTMISLLTESEGGNSLNLNTQDVLGIDHGINKLTLEDPESQNNIMITNSQANQIKWDNFDETVASLPPDIIAEMDDSFVVPSTNFNSNKESTPSERRIFKEITNITNNDSFSFGSFNTSSDSKVSHSNGITNLSNEMKLSNYESSCNENSNYLITSDNGSSLVLFHDSYNSQNESKPKILEVSDHENDNSPMKSIPAPVIFSQILKNPLNELNIIEVCKNLKLFKTFLKEWRQKSYFSIAVNIHLAQIHVSVCWGSSDVYYITLCSNSGDKESQLILADLNQFFDSPRSNVDIFSYDLKSVYKSIAAFFNVSLQGNCVDPSLAAWVIEPEVNARKSLEDLTTEFIPEQKHLLKTFKQYCKPTCNKNSIRCCAPIELQCCAVSFLSYHLTKKLSLELKDLKVWNTFLSVEMSHLIIISDLELNGIQIDKEKLTNLKNKLHTLMKELEFKAHSFTVTPFKLSSPQEVAKVLYQELGLPANGVESAGNSNTINFQKITKCRKPQSWRLNSRKMNLKAYSTNKPALKKLSKLHPLPSIINDWRLLSYTLTNFVTPLAKEVSEECLTWPHKPYCLIQTVTGRVSMAEPNIQNIPKDFSVNSKGKCVKFSPRNIFTACHGHSFVSVDYCQLEFRIFAHYANDDGLIRILNQNEIDVFCMIASKWKNIAINEVTDEIRQITKQICYGMLYGIGEKALSEQLNSTEEEAEKFMQSFMNAYPGIKQCIQIIKKTCSEKGYITTILNRRRYFHKITDKNLSVRSQAERQAVNSTIQGSAADIVKTATVKLMHLLKKNDKKCDLVLQLHDEIMIQVHNSILTKVIKIVKQCFEDAVELKVSLPVKIKVGLTWGEMEIKL